VAAVGREILDLVTIKQPQLAGSADRSVRTAVTSRLPAPPSSSRIYCQFLERQRRIERDACRGPYATADAPDGPGLEGEDMIVLGLVLLVVGFLLHISILTTLGIILLVIGAVLAILGGTGRMVGGRRHWY
jgi:hypothetical protein